MNPTTIIFDMGGVLLTPFDIATAFHSSTGIPFRHLASAVIRSIESGAGHPLHEWEKGLMSEAEFFDYLARHIEAEIGHQPSLEPFRQRIFSEVRAEIAMVDFVRALRARGARTAMLTNNTREWEPRWREIVPIDELFEVFVSSAHVGMRKPDRRIYELVLERLGGVAAADCLFVDDDDENCRGAEAVGIRSIRFLNAEQAIADIERALGAVPAA